MNKISHNLNNVNRVLPLGTRKYTYVMFFSCTRPRFKAYLCYVSHALDLALLSDVNPLIDNMLCGWRMLMNFCFMGFFLAYLLEV